MDVLLADLIAHIEAAGAGPGVTLAPNPTALIVLVTLVAVLLRGYNQIAVLKTQADVLLVEARHVDGELVLPVLLTHIRVHQGAVQRVLGALTLPTPVTPVVEEGIVEEVAEDRIVHQCGKHSHNHIS